MEKENKITANTILVGIVTTIFFTAILLYAIDYLNDQNDIRELKKQELKLNIKLKKLQLGEEDEEI